VLKLRVLGRKGDNKVSGRAYVFRYLAGFLSAGIAVLIVRINEYASGVVLAFPAVAVVRFDLGLYCKYSALLRSFILFSLSALWVGQGESVAMSAATPMIIGMNSTGIFALLFSFIIARLQALFLFLFVMFSLQQLRSNWNVSANLTMFWE
jgi:hypothetical protein